MPRAASCPPEQGLAYRLSHTLRGASLARATFLIGGALALGAGAVPTVAAAAIKVGTPSHDILRATPAGDTLYGGGGSDVLTGNVGDDIIYGVRSGNFIDGGAGNNYIEGGTGDDEITAGGGKNTVYGGTGNDTITLGNGDNYVDPGAAQDEVTLGSGNNVINAGAGGMKLRAGNGNNIVYYRSGPDDIKLGSGVNLVYVATVGQLAKVDCGGNPKSVLFVNSAADPGLALTASAQREDKIVGCPTLMPFDGPPLPVSQSASKTGPFALVGTPGVDRLYGGHGGGTIDGVGGNDIIWADREHDTGGEFARSKTTRILSGDGDSQIFGGRGSNIIKVGNGRNFIRGGAFNNDIAVGTGSNVIRLRGKGVNVVSIGGGTAYVESFANGDKRPSITCKPGASAVVVYGVRKPQTNCTSIFKAGTKLGQQAQVQGIDHIPDADPVVPTPLAPGQDGKGVPRPPIVVPAAG